MPRSSIRRPVVVAAWSAATLLAISAPPSRAAIGLTAPDSIAVIPFRLVNNHILFRGRVNDSDSLWFLLDSGAQGHVFSLTTAKRLGFEAKGSMVAHGAGGHVDGGLIGPLDLSTAGIEMRGISLHAIPLDGIGIQNGLGCDAVLGHEIFERNAVEIDYARGTITVRPSARFEYGGEGAIVPVTFDQNLPYITGRLALPGRTPVEGRFVLDTGSSLALLLSPAFVEQSRAVETVPRVLEVRLGGVGGASFSPMGRIGRLEIGPFALTGPITTFRRAGPGQIAAEGASGNIGGEILRRFRVIFDYARRRVIFERGPGFTEPFEADMSGLVLRVREDSTRAIDVVRVNADSPASESGVREGDVLESMDGVTVNATMLLDIRRRLRVPGETCRLGLRRGGALTVRTLTTRRLI